MNPMDKRTLRLKASVSAKADGIYRFIGSTAAVDRVGEVVEQNWNLENYKKNPVILYGHDQTGLPIGKAVNVAVENGALTFDVKFVPAEVYPFAGTVEAMYRDGFLNAVSVGFIPTDIDGNTIKAAELLELSAVPVPANHEALMQRGARKMMPVFRAFDHAELVKTIANRDAFDQFFAVLVEKAMNDEDEKPKKKSLPDLLTLVLEAISDLEEGDVESVRSDLAAISAMIQIMIDESTPEDVITPEGDVVEGDPGAGEDVGEGGKSFADLVLKQLGAPAAHSIESVLADSDAVSAILKAIGTPKEKGV
jgi:HK97 family phage prohead protease